MISRESGIAAVILALAAPCLAGTDTRTSGFDYDPATGWLIKEIIEPGDPNLCQVTTYTHDSFGNRTSATTRNCNGSTYGMGAYTEAAAPTGDAVFLPRTSSTGYDSQGRFPTSATNALFHPEQRVFDARFGMMTSLIGPNDLATTWVPDSFGRKSSETRADNTATSWFYERCVDLAGGACPPYGQYRVRVTATGTPTSSTYYDGLNRPIRSEVQGFNGTLVHKDTQYDNLGRVFRVSRPYYAGAAPVWTTFVLYDLLGRATRVDEPDLKRTSTDYTGLVTTVEVSKDGSGTGMPGGAKQVQITTRNSQGQVTQVTRQ